MMNDNRTAAVVVTYNRKDLLLENLRALLGQKGGAPDVLVIDNASTDGTADAVAELIRETGVARATGAGEPGGEIIYINTGANLGGAGGFQYGIREAAERGYKYIWVMDDDCIPHEDTLAEFLRADRQLADRAGADTVPYGYLSSKVLWKDGTLCAMNVQRHPLTKNITDFSGDLIPATMASFVSLFLRSEVVWELGLPIKEFFIWTDDWEYTRRISRKYPCYVVPASAVTHKSGSNIGAFIWSESPERLERFYYLYRNDVYLYRREGLKRFCYEAVRLAGHAMRVLVKAPDHRLRRLGYIIKGTAAGLRFHPPVTFPERTDP